MITIAPPHKFSEVICKLALVASSALPLALLLLLSSTSSLAEALKSSYHSRRLAELVNDETVLDLVVATVDGEPITLADLSKQLEDPNHSSLQLLKEQLPQPDSLAKKLLKKEIAGKLIELEAKELKLEVDPTELEEQIRSIQTANGLDQKGLSEALKSEGQTLEQLKQSLKWQLLRSKVVGHYLRKRVVISDQEIEREIKARLGDSYSGREKTDSSDSVTLSQILLSREQHSSSELRSLLDKIESSLAAGADFGELARQYSEGPTAQTGGDLGAISWKDLDPKLRKMLRALEPGEVSKAWNTASSIQLFKRPASREQNLRDTALRAKIKKELEQEQASLELKDILENQIPTRHTIEELF